MPVQGNGCFICASAPAVLHQLCPHRIFAAKNAFPDGKAYDISSLSHALFQREGVSAVVRGRDRGLEVKGGVLFTSLTVYARNMYNL